MAAPKRKQLTAAEWFGRVDEFWAASAHLGKNVPHLTTPNVVSGAFAMEAYLKCLLTLRKKAFPPDHNLHRLFKLLPIEDRNAIEKVWNEDALPKILQAQKTAPKAFAGHMPKTLNQALKRAREAFKEWRYMTTGGVRYFTVGRFGMHVRDVILQIHPEWRADPPDIFGRQSKDQSPRTGSTIPRAERSVGGNEWQAVPLDPGKGFRRE